MIVYKYLKKEHLGQFKNKGTVAIRNIYSFRSIEKEEIRDEEEGRKSHSIKPKQGPVEFSRQQWNNLETNWVLRGNGRGPRFESGSKGIINYTVPNAFCFCTSCRLDKELMKEFGYDAYYKINDIHLFAQALCDELRKSHTIVYAALGKVQYVKTKVVEITNFNKDKICGKPPEGINVNDYFRKTEGFANENEYRVVFGASDPIGEGSTFLNCKKLLEHCDV